MKRLFLASSELEGIKTFVGREPSSVKMLFTPTAANLDDDVWWIDKDREVLGKMGFIITEADIAMVPLEELKAMLDATYIVYVAGGNTFYLLKILRETGFYEVLTDYVNKGGLYAGASAGALVAGADIAPIATIDEPEKVEGLISTKCLGLVHIIPIPHYDMHERASEIDAIKAKYGKKFEIVLMTDDQAIVVEGNTWKLVYSKRSDLELEWFRKNHLMN